MKTMLGSIALPNPVMPASGTFGFGYEMAKWYDINCLGAIALKGTTLSARYGNPLPRIAECDCGLLNAIGLQNPGVDAVIAEELPRLNAVYRGVKLANISGFSLEEYAETAARLDGADVDILEINISCPNVHGGGLAFGADARNAARVCAEVKKRCRKPIYMKLSPNVTDICAIARACEAEGADGLTVTNTLLGMVIDPRSGKPIVSTKMAGFSGPAIKPVSLRMVYQVYEAVRIPSSARAASPRRTTCCATFRRARRRCRWARRTWWIRWPASASSKICRAKWRNTASNPYNPS